MIPLERSAWQDHAACRGVGTDVFYPSRGSVHPGSEDHIPPAAAALCAACPVRQECLYHALERPEQIGVWGGTSGRERRAMRRRAAAQRNPQATA